MLSVSTARLYQQSRIRRTRKMDLILDLKVADTGGCGWMSLAHRDGKTSHQIKSLQISVDVHGFAWIAVVERAMGIEPTSSAWEAEVMAIIRRPQNA